MTPQELADLDFAVAHAEGIVDQLEAVDREGASFVRRSDKQKPGAAPLYEAWAPTRDHGLAMRLLEKYQLGVGPCSTGWHAYGPDMTGELPSGATPAIAVCKAVVALRSRP